MGEASDNLRGAGLMVAAMLAFAVNDTFLKLLGGEMTVWQVLFLRGCLVTPLMFLLARSRGASMHGLPRRAWVLTWARALFEALGAVFFVSALVHMPLGNITAIMQALPMTVSVAAIFFLGHSMGWRRGLAIAIGFICVLVVVRPGPEGFGIWTPLALLSVLAVTARDILSRMIPPEVPSLSVAAYSALGVTLVAALGLPFVEWRPLGAQDLGFLTGSIAAIMIGYVCSVSAMRVGEISFVAPFRYSGLIVALILGFVVFGDWPDALTLLGAAGVVATGLFTLYRERKASAGRT